MDIDWIRIAKEIRDVPGGAAVLRILQAHGLTHIVRWNDAGSIGNSNSITDVIDCMHREPR